MVRHLLVTNDFPPKIGGIQNYLWELWRRLPADDVIVHTTPHDGAEAWDATQDFTVVRSREPWLLPQPMFVRRVNQLAESYDAEVVIIDRASELMPDEMSGKNILRALRKFTSEGRTLILTIDPDEMDGVVLRDMKNSAEVVLDMMTAVVGGQMVRTVGVTRFLRAAGPVTERIGWKVMPEMGFIVDITAVA